jgi:YD repeat-containing protein
VVTKCSTDGSGNEICTSKWEPLPRGGRLPIAANPNINLPVTGPFIASSTDWLLQSSSSFDGINTEWLRSFMSPDGNIHSVGQSVNSSIFPYPVRSLDGTGLMHLDANTLVLPNGVRYSYVNSTMTQPGFWPTSVTDPHGNQITIAPSGWTDTMGRVIPASGNQPGVSTTDLSACPAGTVSARVWDVPGYTPVSATRRFTVCYANVSIFTNFGVQGVEEYPATSTPLLSAVVQPDGTKWTLAYDNYGSVTRLGLPTGGSISYTYGSGSIECGSDTLSKSWWVKSRTVDANDGTGPHTWQYNYAGQVSGSPEVYSGTATVSAPDGNDTVHTITSPVPGAYCSLYDTQVKHYQGSSGTGTLLNTVSTQYTGIVDQFTGPPTAANVVPVQVTTTWPDGRSSRVVHWKVYQCRPAKGI